MLYLWRIVAYPRFIVTSSLWLSAAIGVGAGGALYFVSIYSVRLCVIVMCVCVCVWRFCGALTLARLHSTDCLDSIGTSIRPHVLSARRFGY